MKRLTETLEVALWAVQAGALTTRADVRGVAESIVSAMDRRTSPRGRPHQFRHWIPTKTRSRPASFRVGSPGGSIAGLIRTVSVGSTCVPMLSETRFGATGNAQGLEARFVTVSVPRSDWVAPWRLPVSFSWASLQCGSTERTRTKPSP